MSTLVVTDQEPTAGGKYIVDQLMRHAEEKYELISVFGAIDIEQAKKMKAEDWLKHSPRVLNKAQQHDRILCVGPLATACVSKAETPVRITKVRGGGMRTPQGIYYVPTFGFSTIFKEPDFYRDFEMDVLKLLTSTEPIPPPRVETIILETQTDLRQFLGEMHGASMLSCDIETTGFNPMTDRILSIGFGALLEQEGEGYVVIVPEDLLQGPRGHVSRFMRTYQGLFVLHNLKFDVQHIWNRYGQFTLKNATDTMLMGYTLDERPFNRFKHLSLKDMSRVYLDAPDYGLNMKEWLQEFAEVEDKEPLLTELYEYQALDCYYTIALYPILKACMEEESDRLFNYLNNTLVPLSFSLAKMELTGVPVNRRYLQKMEKTINSLLDEEIVEIRKLVCKYTNHPKKEEFNPNSPKQVAEVLYNAGDEGGLGLVMPKDTGRYAYKREEGKITTNSDTLKVLARQIKKERPAISKLINLILSYRVKSKIIGTYVTGLLERTDADGRVRGDFNLHGTATGRLSCSNPNLQNIPDASHVGFDIRKAYVPPPGWVMLEADYSQLELRIAALFSQDPILLDAYRNGADIHQEVAYMLWQKPKDEITKYERYLAKCMNFGVIYGRGAKSIATGPEMDNLVEMSGRSWSEKEINEYFAKFKVGYKSLFDWMELIADNGFLNKYVEAPLGSRRRWHMVRKGDESGVRRQCANTPIQGFAAQMTSRALHEISNRFDSSIQSVFFTVHDSIVCGCINDKEVVAETSHIIQDVMENHLPQDAVVSFPVLDHAPFKEGDRLLYNLPFVSEVAYGKSWGECKHTIARREESVYVSV